MVAFASKKGINMLANGKKWFLDGTFKCVPKIFYQLVTFHTIYKQRGWPCLHVLLSSKSEPAYLLMYHDIKRCFTNAGFPSVRPKSINVDYEQGMLNAIRHHYPNAAIHGCYFHYCQAVYRKLTELGLASAFLNNKAFFIWTKKILACPYLPLSEMEDYFVEHILQYLSNDDDLRELAPAINHFADYVTTQWFENTNIPQSIWNVYDRADDDRTNNCCECWHAKWNKKTVAPHPHIWRYSIFLNKL